MGVVYTQELLERAQAYVAQPLNDKRQPAGMVELGDIYSAITGDPPAKCRQCKYSDFLAVVVAYIREASHFLHPETVSDSSYSIVPGLQNETFTHADYSKAVKADNLTDADAEFFIKHGYEHAFVKKAAAKTEADGTPALTSLHKADLQAKYKDVVGSEADDKLTKAQLIEAIEAASTDQA